MKLTSFLPFFLFLFFVHNISAQSISGVISNVDSEPIPFVNIWIPQLNTGTTADAEGNYFIVLDVAGEYDLIFSSLGYESKSMEIVFSEKAEILNVQLETANLEFDEVVVTASKRDPAYAIMKKVVDNKEKYLRQAESYRTNVYIKATEVAGRKEKNRKNKSKDRADAQNLDNDEEDFLDIFAKEERKRIAELMKLSLLEIELVLNYQHPNKYKEERNAYSLYGDKSALFVPLFGEVNFNFYKNMVAMIGVAENSIISPVSRLAVLTYRFKLVETTVENKITLYKIKVIPRKKGSSTCSGFIYINDGIWNINRLELEIDDGGLKFFDKLTVHQRYINVQDSLWIVDRLEFDYLTKLGKSSTFKGNTLIRFSEYEHNFKFSPKFFNNELSVISQEAYERDTSYWSAVRPEALSIKEQKMTQHRDSIKAIYSSKAYKDSIQANYNRISFTDIVYGGVGFQNHEKLKHTYIGSLPELIDFSVVGGWRIGPYFGYSKRWKDGRFISTNTNVNIGIENQDIQGSGSVYYRYNALRLANIHISGGRSFYSINPHDAYLNQLKVSNYILLDDIDIGHSFEILNGLRLHTSISFSERKSVENYNWKTAVDDIFDVQPEPLSFENYKAFNTVLSLSYTPGQRYMTEPTRKIILGSKYPTFSISHRKGWNGMFSSDTDFDFVRLGISQNVSLGSIGQSKYELSMGQYINSKNLPTVDLKRFRESDPILFSDPLTSFQLLDTSFASTKLFFEFHHIHHFNGALINNIPLIKKTKIRAVAGGGILWVKEANFRHGEIFAGVERVFKVGKRRRLRIGTYGALANSSFSKTRGTFKISFDIIDSWKRDWSF